MHARAVGRTLASLVTLLAFVAIAPPVHADGEDVDPTAPVVVNDTLVTWPGASTVIDVLANDTDPGGDDLAICLFPTQGFDEPSDVWVYDMTTSPFSDGSEVGHLQVSVDDRALGTYTFDYYTCSRTRLTPATLTVVVQKPKPVTVRPTGHRGYVSITNHNDDPVRVDTWGPRYCGSASRSVPAHSTRELRVHHSVIHWSATIGESAIADHGTTRDIPLRAIDATIGLWCRSAPHADRRDAAAVDPTAPVVTDDEITVWPGGTARIDVLANDTDPTGDALAPCRLPSYLTANGRTRPAAIRTAAFDDLPAGTLIVDTSAHATGVHQVHYFVCSHTRLTRATLTVTVRDVAPVDVAPTTDRPGRITVTNHNEMKVFFFATDRSGCRIDAREFVGAGATRSFAVRDETIRWQAVVGDETSVGVIGHGTLRDVPLDGPAAKPITNRQCVTGWVFGRQAG